MIAGCPKCGARYRIDRAKLTSGGVRLRCAKCEAVFRVRAPEAAQDLAEQTQLSPIPAALREAPPAQVKPVAQAAVASPPKLAPPPPVAASTPSGDLVLIAIPEADVAKRLADTLAARGLRSVIVHDGVEAVLEIQRKLPKAAIVAAHLPKMFGFQICELVKRNDSLRNTWLVLVGAIHNQERYRRPAGETYGADAYLEMPDLPEGALALLTQGGLTLGSAVPQRTPAPPPPAAASPRPRTADGLEEQRAKAERLARIIVSDIVLYNEQKFAAALKQGNVVEALDGDLSEGRHLFQERIDARVRAERDFLADELVRIAKQRGMK